MTAALAVRDAAEVLVPQVRERLAEVRDRIARCGPTRPVVVVAVTKGFGAEVPVAAALAGLTDLGENYADELVEKARTLGALALPVRWHFLGALQTNKINRLAPHVALWQTVDSVHRVEALAKRAPGAAVLVEVDLSGVPGRGGCRPEEVGAVVAAARSGGLDVRGLMGVGPDPEVVGDAASRSAFGRLAALAGELGLPELSMGMTHDLEAAVGAGATMVRVGEALFGPRPGPVGGGVAAGSGPNSAPTAGSSEKMVVTTRSGRAGRWPASGTR